MSTLRVSCSVACCRGKGRAGVFHAAVLTCVVLAAGTASARPVVQIATGEYPPYASLELPRHGLTLHVIREAYRIEGYQVEYTFMNWNQAWDAALNGSAFDGTAFWFRSAERARDFHYSDRVLVEEYMFFHRTETPLYEWNSLEGLAPYRVAATRGYTYTEEFYRLAREGALNVEFAFSDIENLRKLLDGEADLFPVDFLVGFHLIHRHLTPEESARLSFNPRPLLRGGQYLLLRRGRPRAQALLDAFNSGLARLRENGSIELWIEQLRSGEFMGGYGVPRRRE